MHAKRGECMRHKDQQLKPLTYRSVLHASALGMIDPRLKFRRGELSLILF